MFKIDRVSYSYPDIDFTGAVEPLQKTLNILSGQESDLVWWLRHTAHLIQSSAGISLFDVEVSAEYVNNEIVVSKRIELPMYKNYRQILEVKIDDVPLVNGFRLTNYYDNCLVFDDNVSIIGEKLFVKAVAGYGLKYEDLPESMQYKYVAATSIVYLNRFEPDKISNMFYKMFG